MWLFEEKGCVRLGNFKKDTFSPVEFKEAMSRVKPDEIIRLDLVIGDERSDGSYMYNHKKHIRFFEDAGVKFIKTGNANHSSWHNLWTGAFKVSDIVGDKLFSSHRRVFTNEYSSGRINDVRYCCSGRIIQKEIFSPLDVARIWKYRYNFTISVTSFSYLELRYKECPEEITQFGTVIPLNDGWFSCIFTGVPTEKDKSLKKLLEYLQGVFNKEGP